MVMMMVLMMMLMMIMLLTWDDINDHANDDTG